jgi:hypothetical protein
MRSSSEAGCQILLLSKFTAINLEQPKFIIQRTKTHWKKYFKKRKKKVSKFISLLMLSVLKSSLLKLPLLFAIMQMYLMTCKFLIKDPNLLKSLMRLSREPILSFGTVLLESSNSKISDQEAPDYSKVL